jgi:hypothetical protein
MDVIKRRSIHEYIGPCIVCGKMADMAGKVHSKERLVAARLVDEAPFIPLKSSICKYCRKNRFNSRRWDTGKAELLQLEKGNFVITKLSPRAFNVIPVRKLGSISENSLKK